MMEEFCPICSKIGKKSKVRLFQVNFTEAQLHCEDEECIYPFSSYYKDVFMFRDMRDILNTSIASPSVSNKNPDPLEIDLNTQCITPLKAVSKDGSPTNKGNSPDIDMLTEFNISEFLTEYSQDMQTTPIEVEFIKNGLLNQCNETLEDISEEVSYPYSTDISSLCTVVSEENVAEPECTDQDIITIDDNTNTDEELKKQVLKEDINVKCKKKKKRPKKVHSRNTHCEDVDDPTEENVGFDCPIIKSKGDTSFDFSDICSNSEEFGSLKISSSIYPSFNKHTLDIRNKKADEPKILNVTNCDRVIDSSPKGQVISDTLSLNQSNKTIVVKCNQDIPLPGWNAFGKNVISISIIKPTSYENDGTSNSEVVQTVSNDLQEQSSSVNKYQTVPVVRPRMMPVLEEHNYVEISNRSEIGTNNTVVPKLKPVPEKHNYVEISNRSEIDTNNTVVPNLALQKSPDNGISLQDITKKCSGIAFTNTPHQKTKFERFVFQSVNTAEAHVRVITPRAKKSSSKGGKKGKYASKRRASARNVKKRQAETLSDVDGDLEVLENLASMPVQPQVDGNASLSTQSDTKSNDALDDIEESLNQLLENESISLQSGDTSVCTADEEWLKSILI